MATYPGINKSFNLQAFKKDEALIIERLSRYFYVTRSVDPIWVGNSQYMAFLMRPAEVISTILNVEREIAVLFADYTTYEARTLTAYEKLYEQFDDERIDKTVRILISRDSEIAQRVRHYLEKDPEYPVVIPYTYEDFLSTTDNFILTRMRSNYLIRDLFGYQSPLKQEHFFFGRDALVNQVIDLHKAGQNASLFGLRKSGKTSTIYAIQRRAKALGRHAIVIDCQDPAVHAREYQSLLLFILNQVRASLNLKPIADALGDKPDRVSEQFQSLMIQTLSAARSDILIMFDEIENISPKTAASPHWRVGYDTLLFWQTLRAFFQKTPKHKVTFCFVGTNPHLFETAKINDVDNPVYLFAKPTYIEPLTFAATKQMCERLGYFMGLDFDGPIIGRMHQRLGGHPFFIRQLCSKIHQLEPPTRPIAVSARVCEAAEMAEAAITSNYIKEILNGLRVFYPEEYEVLEYLAAGDLGAFNSVVHDYPEFVEHLLGYGIIRNRGDEYEFLFDAVRASFGVSAKVGADARRIEVGERRNKLEEEVRTALFHWSSRLSDDEWDGACDSCIPKQIERVGRLAPRAMFSRKQSPLYFIDLMKFTEYSGAFFSDSMRSDIMKAFDTVNRQRIDAHAKDMAPDEFREWSSAMRRLEDIFIPPQ